MHCKGNGAYETLAWDPFVPFFTLASYTFASILFRMCASIVSDIGRVCALGKIFVRCGCQGDADFKK